MSEKPELPSTGRNFRCLEKFQQFLLRLSPVSAATGETGTLPGRIAGSFRGTGTSCPPDRDFQTETGTSGPKSEISGLILFATESCFLGHECLSPCFPLYLCCVHAGAGSQAGSRPGRAKKQVVKRSASRGPAHDEEEEEILSEEEHQPDPAWVQSSAARSNKKNKGPAVSVLRMSASDF